MDVYVFSYMLFFFLYQFPLEMVFSHLICEKKKLFLFLSQFFLLMKFG